MKKVISIILLIIISASIFAGCSKSENQLSTLESIKKSGKLVIGLDDAYPPMEYRDEKNNLVGFDVDFANALAEKIGVKLEIVTTDFNGIVLALQAKKFDAIISALSVTDERKKSIDFVGPYIYGGQVLIVKSGNIEVKNASDLKGKILACQLGSTGEKAGMKIDGLKELRKYSKVPEALSDLGIGRVDAVIADYEVGAYYAKKQGGGFTILEDRISKEPEGIGVRKEDKDLSEALQKVLDELKADGTLSKISMKWFGYDIYNGK